jgi:hypothetical protein
VLIAAAIVLVGGADNGPARPPTDTVRAAHGPTPRATSPRAGIGPEGVPLLGGAPLGPARSPLPGKSSGGIPCGSTEQLTYHVHARLTLVIRGKSRSVPLGIGIGPPVRVNDTARGPFAAGGKCFSFLHTHASDGIIHIEAPAKINFKLGQFFDVWQQRLDSRHLGSTTGRVVAYVNGRRFRGDPRAILLRKHAQIQLAVGQPFVAPASITFPRGL